MKEPPWVSSFTLKLTEKEKEEFERSVVMGEVARKTTFPVCGPWPKPDLWPDKGW